MRRFKSLLCATFVMIAYHSSVLADTTSVALDIHGPNVNLPRFQGVWEVLVDHPLSGLTPPKRNTLDVDDWFSVDLVTNNITAEPTYISVTLFENALNCSIPLELEEAHYFSDLDAVVVTFNDYTYESPQFGADCAITGLHTLIRKSLLSHKFS